MANQLSARFIKLPKERQPYLEGDSVVIPLQGGRLAYADASDFELIKRFTWHQSGCGYVICGSRKKFYLHRYLMDAKKGECVDHIDRDVFNNRRSNLRLASYRQNAWNSIAASHNKLGIKGVQRLPHGSYRAFISVKNKTVHLGCFPTAELAARARDAAAIQYHGEFARLNFPLPLVTRKEAQ